MLGCASPIVLRATSSGKYNVIGESFTYGLNDAMALLGPLPDGWVVQAFTGRVGIYLRPPVCSCGKPVLCRTMTHAWNH